MRRVTSAVGRLSPPRVKPPLFARFGIRSLSQVRSDLGELVRGSLSGERFQFGVSSAGLVRPDLSLPAYAGRVPEDGLAPIFNLFDVVGGGRHYSQRVTRRTVMDFRGGRLSYDEHDGVDFVCPIGTPLCAAAAGTVVMIRDRWLRGGLTVAVDHGGGVVTQYTHCAEAILPLGERVERGQPVALSGASGYDLVQFFPWVPPHVHFMLWIDGRPVDPYGGRWQGGAPVPAGESEPIPDVSEIDEAALRSLISSCLDDRIRQELASADGATAAALAEDALHHDRYAWPRDSWDTSVRPPRTGPPDVAISLPLPGDTYRGAYFADTLFTRPRLTSAANV